MEGLDKKPNMRACSLLKPTQILTSKNWHGKSRQKSGSCEQSDSGPTPMVARKALIDNATISVP
jgi:hypothetical protein